MFGILLDVGLLKVPSGGDQPLKGVLPLSVVLAVGSIPAGLIPLLNDRRMYKLPVLFRSINVRDTVLAIVVALTVKVIQWALTDRTAIVQVNSLQRQMAVAVTTAVAKPGISLLLYFPRFALLSCG